MRVSRNVIFFENISFFPNSDMSTCASSSNTTSSLSYFPNNLQPLLTYSRRVQHPPFMPPPSPTSTLGNVSPPPSTSPTPQLSLRRSSRIIRPPDCLSLFSALDPLSIP